MPFSPEMILYGLLRTLARNHLRFHVGRHHLHGARCQNTLVGLSGLRLNFR